MNHSKLTFETAQMSEFILQIGHCGWLGMRYAGHGEDWAELELPWRADLVGDEAKQAIASGPIISLLDMASGIAIWARRKAFVPIATLDLRVDYQRPSRDHMPIKARVECFRDTRSAAFLRGVAYDDSIGDPVATMSGVFMNIAGNK